MQQSVLYEFPLNERMRNFMRLENYFKQINYFLEQGSSWATQTSLLLLIEILNLVERHDIRNELNKELERNITNLSALAEAPEVNGTALQEILDQLQTQVHALSYARSIVAKPMREDDLLNSIRQRVAVASNINSFDVPGFYFWLNQDVSFQQKQFASWLAELQPVETGTNLILNLLRDSAMFESKTADSGFYQKSLNTQLPCQIVRICLPANCNYFPETSGSKHRISIRFLGYEANNQRPVQVTQAVDFELSCCGI